MKSPFRPNDPVSIKTILDPILAKLSHMGKHQRTFLIELFSLLLARQGKATFENMARFSPLTELTFRRHFASFFVRSVGPVSTFNKACVDFSKGVYVGLVDCSFIPKSGSETFGLDKFWSGCAAKALRSLEISVLACVNVNTKQCFALESTQTSPGLSASATAKEPEKPYNRVSFYLEQLGDCLPQLPAIRHWAGDGFYAKKEVFDLFIKHKRHFITRLRRDADLYFLWNKPRLAGQRGAPKKYDGKAVFDDLSRWQKIGAHPQHPYISLYAQALYSKHFGRSLQVVLLLDTRTNKYVLLASTDLTQSATEIAYYYHLRFQIEILFRDLTGPTFRQFTGLAQCQARSGDKLDYHFNACLSGVNVARLMVAGDDSLQGSLNALVRRQTGERIWQVIYGQLSPESRVALNHIDPTQWQFWQRKAA